MLTALKCSIQLQEMLTNFTLRNLYTERILSVII